MYKFFFILFFTIQFYLTIFGGFLWPFSSHRLFSQYPGETKNIIQITVIDSENKSQTIHPGRVLPIEYCRCSGLIRNIYHNQTIKNKLENYILNKINDKPWFVFDEMLPMVKGSNFVEIIMEEHILNLTNFAIIDKKEIAKNENKNKIDLKYKILYFAFVLCSYPFISLNFNENYENKIKRIKLSLSAVILILLILGPYNDFYQNEFLYQCKLPFLNFFYLKYLVITLNIIYISNINDKVVGLLFALLFNYFQYYITCFSTTYSITNNHLNIFLLLLNLPLNSGFQYKFIITYISCLYFQAGLSKLLLGGLKWMDGKRIRVEILLLGTNLGKYLLNFPFIFPILGTGTFILEILLSPLFLVEKYSFYISLIFISFHLGTYLTMGISFWFLWILFPIIF